MHRSCKSKSSAQEYHFIQSLPGAEAGASPPTGDIAHLLNRVTQNRPTQAQHNSEDDDDAFEDTTQNTPVASPAPSVVEGLDVNNSSAPSTVDDESQDSQDDTTRCNETQQQRFRIQSVGEFRKKCPIVMFKQMHL